MTRLALKLIPPALRACDFCKKKLGNRLCYTFPGFADLMNLARFCSKKCMKAALVVGTLEDL